MRRLRLRDRVRSMMSTWLLAPLPGLGRDRRAAALDHVPGAGSQLPKSRHQATAAASS